MKSLIPVLIFSLIGIARADDAAFHDLLQSGTSGETAAQPPKASAPVSQPQLNFAIAGLTGLFSAKSLQEALELPEANYPQKRAVREVAPDNDAPGYDSSKRPPSRTVAPNLPGNVSAFLDVIAYAEGTQGWGNQDGYNVMYTYKVFTDYSHHPNTINCGGGWCSDAAGRYQFLFQTWEEVRQKLNLQDFSSIRQDLGCLELLRRRWAYEDVENSSDYNRFTSAVYKCNKEWASLPGSPYGQPTRSMADLWAHYQEFRKNYPK